MGTSRRLIIPAGAAALCLLACGCSAKDPIAARGPVREVGQSRSAAVPTAISAPDAQTMLDLVRALAPHDDARVAGTEGERKAAELLAERFRAIGLDVATDEFPITAFYSRGGSVTVGEGSAFEAIPLFYSPPTPKGGIEALLVDGGQALPEELARVDAKGKILLARRGRIFFRDKAANASRAGAVGLVVFDPALEELQATLIQMAPIPCLAVGAARGGELEALAAGGSARVRIEADTEIKPATSRNLVARRPVAASGASGRKKIVVGAHLDSVFTPGALDNATGLACLVELARSLAHRELAFDLLFVCFGAEELGTLGSRHFVESRGVSDIAAMLALDTVGSGVTTMIYSSGGHENAVTRAAVEAAKGLGLSHQAGASDASDHLPFAHAGVSAAFLMREPENRYHSDLDEPGIVSAEAMLETLKIAEAAILELAGGE